ncbi:defective in tip formation protein A-like [Cyprinodon tularosa]|uniref:defective in tip formation protein A-like n=1 Tax=Cyprinodon tularosa TaxID=77115 RepID=UPI0018E1EA83|nr:defective in tip formation protein A-like [Cyprinodon tularosa]
MPTTFPATTVTPTTVMPTTITSTTVATSTVPLTTLNPPPKTSHLTVVRLKISTKLSLKDDQDKIVKALKKELIKQGLPPDIKIRLLSNGSLEVSKTADH